MLCHVIEKDVHTASFRYDSSINLLDLEETQDPNELDGRYFDVFEDRREVDGSLMPQHGLTETVGMLVAPPDTAPAIREALNNHGAHITESTFTSQFGDYVGFRAFNLYEDTPQAPVFRIRTAPDNPGLWMDQYYTAEFAEWLKANFDTRGLVIRLVDKDPHFYRPDKE